MKPDETGSFFDDISKSCKQADYASGKLWRAWTIFRGMRTFREIRVYLLSSRLFLGFGFYRHRHLYLILYSVLVYAQIDI